MKEPDFEWLMIAASHVKAHARAAGSETYKSGRNTKIHLTVDAHGMPVRVIVTARSPC